MGQAAAGALPLGGTLGTCRSGPGTWAPSRSAGERTGRGGWRSRPWVGGGRDGRQGSHRRRMGGRPGPPGPSVTLHSVSKPGPAWSSRQQRDGLKGPAGPLVSPDGASPGRAGQLCTPSLPPTPPQPPLSKSPPRARAAGGTVYSRTDSIQGLRLPKPGRAPSPQLSGTSRMRGARPFQERSALTCSPPVRASLGDATGIRPLQGFPGSRSRRPGRSWVLQARLSHLLLGGPSQGHGRGLTRGQLFPSFQDCLHMELCLATLLTDTTQNQWFYVFHFHLCGF